jgi:hypothetical protein
MASIDLNDAYYSVPMAAEHQKYLKFSWQGRCKVSHLGQGNLQRCKS